MKTYRVFTVGFLVFLFVCLWYWEYAFKHLRYVFISPSGPVIELLDVGATSTIAAPHPISEPNRLYIPSLSIEAPILFIEKKTEAVYQEALKKGVVHFPGTAQVGELGNMYIFGHSSDYPWSGGEYKTVFALLPQIQDGALVVVTDGAGKKFEYRVIEARVVAKDDLSVLSQFEKKKRLLTVQTSYPLGTALKRFIVVAELKASAQ